MAKEASFALEVALLGNELYAREEIPGTKLPAECFNRHIMPCGYFCLGLNYGTLVSSEEKARLWWQSLAEYLKLQEIAKVTGRWPRHMELDHGDAGKYHRAALNAAAELGLLEEYELALLGKDSWITDGSVRLDKTGTRLLNGRAVCPVDCPSGRRLRRDCCSQHAVVSLLAAERQRSRLLRKFWETQKRLGQACCGTMIDCPLKKQA